MYYSLINIAIRHIIRLTFSSYQLLLINQFRCPLYLALLFLFINYWLIKQTTRNSFLCILMLEFEPCNSKKEKYIPEIAANMKALISALIVRRDFLKDNSTQRNNLIEFNFFLVVKTTCSTIKIQFIPSRLQIIFLVWMNSVEGLFSNERNSYDFLCPTYQSFGGERFSQMVPLHFICFVSCMEPLINSRLLTIFVNINTD